MAKASTPNGSSSTSMASSSSVQARTLAWPMRTWICLSKSCIIGIGSAAPPYTPEIETVPPRRTASMAVCRAASRSMPAFFIIGSAIASGSRPAIFCTTSPPGEPCASMPTASMTASAPRPSVSSRTTSPTLPTLLGVVEVERLGAERLDPCEPLRHAVDGDDAMAVADAHPGRHVSDRSGAEHEQRAAVGHVGVLQALPRRRQDVGEEEEPVVGVLVGTLTGRKSANGTRRYSAWPPGTWP